MNTANDDHPAHPHDAHLDTQSVERDLRTHAVRGGIVTIGAQGAKFIITTATIGILGRLLTPRDFGLVTMVMVITNLLARFRSLGLETSTVQRSTISHAQVNALFWINLAFGFILTAVVAFASPLIATLYDEPSLISIAIALSALFALGALGAQHQAVLRRRMHFGKLAIIEIVSVTVAGVIAVVMALQGYAYWSLVGMHIAIAFTLTVGVWIASPWRPSRPARAPELKGMIGFGAGVAGSNLLQTIARQADKVLIGITQTTDTLGHYARGYNLLLIPLQQINYPISNVAISALSRLQSDPDRYRLVYRKALLVVLSLCLPPCIFALLFAEQSVLGVLGDQWGEAVPIFRALVPAAIAWTFEPAVRWIYVSLGNSAREFRWRLVTVALTLVAFVIALPWGALGMAIAFSISAVTFRIPEIAYCYRASPVRFADLTKSAWRPAAASLIAGALAFVLPIPSDRKSVV